VSDVAASEDNLPVRFAPGSRGRKCDLGCVPHSMTGNQAKCRVTFSGEHLEVVRRAKETNFEHLLTGDEWWFCYQ
jgi:hypothetical protein